MDLRKLRHFLAVIDTGSLGGAARKLNISQPALSKSIQSFEQSVRTALFIRTAGGMTPTAAARAIETRARIISAEVDRAEGEIREIQEAGRGRIVVGTGPSFAQAILPKAIGKLLKTNPGVEVVVVDGFISTLLPAILAGKIEFALLTLSPQLQLADLDTEILVPRDRALVVTGAGNPLVTRRRTVSLEEIGKGPWVLAQEPDQLRNKLTELFARAGLAAPRAAVEFGSISLALAALREGNLISFLPELLVREGIVDGSFRALRIPELTWERSLGVVSRRGSSFTPGARLLLREIENICRHRRSTFNRTAEVV